jgi:hypothetical protein
MRLSGNSSDCSIIHSRSWEWGHPRHQPMNRQGASSVGRGQFHFAPLPKKSRRESLGHHIIGCLGKTSQITADRARRASLGAAQGLEQPPAIAIVGNKRLSGR